MKKQFITKNSKLCEYKTALLLLIISIIIITILSIHVHNLQNAINKKEINNLTTPIESNPQILSREEWKAKAPKSLFINQTMPIDRIILAHTSSESCQTPSECLFLVQLLQLFRMESQHWNDIGYNFLIGGDGNIYEGHGWFKLGLHFERYNIGSVSIAFIGTFTDREPLEIQLKAAKYLINEGLKSGYLIKDYKLYPQRAFFHTESTDEKLYSVIRAWPHFTEMLR